MSTVTTKRTASNGRKETRPTRSITQSPPQYGRDGEHSKRGELQGLLPVAVDQSTGFSLQIEKGQAWSRFMVHAIGQCRGGLDPAKRGQAVHSSPLPKRSALTLREKADRCKLTLSINSRVRACSTSCKNGSKSPVLGTGILYGVGQRRGQQGGRGKGSLAPALGLW